MVRATKFSLGLAAVIVLGLVSAGATRLTAQDAGKTAPPKPAGAAAGQDREGGKKARQERIEKMKQAIAAAKVPLATAVATAEKESKGKSYRVTFSPTKDGKFEYSIGILVEDKLGTVSVDPDSGKAEPLKFEDENREGREGREGGKEGGGKDGGKKEGGGGN